MMEKIRGSLPIKGALLSGRRTRFSMTSDNAPAYLRLYELLRKEITMGYYRFGDRLLSKRALAAANHVSVITVEHALALLEEEGYIEARERSGCYVIYQSGGFFPPDPSRSPSPDTPAAAPKGAPLAAAPEALSDPADGAPSAKPSAYTAARVFPFPSYARTARRVLSEYGEELLRKAPGAGIPLLREVLAAYLARSRGIFVNPGQIIVGSGAEYLYSLVVQLLGRETVYGLEDPSYEKIRRVYEANGVRCEMLKMGASGITSSALSHTKAGVLHVTPFRSYPSGITADASKRREYISWAVSRGGMIVEDDTDSEFSLSGRAVSTLFALEPEERVLYINTFSRTIAPSMRIGYMLLPEKRAEEMRNALSFYSCSVPVFDQYLVAEFIRSGEFERHINRVRRALRK